MQNKLLPIRIKTMVASRDNRKAALFLKPAPRLPPKDQDDVDPFTQSSRRPGCHQHIPPKRKKFLKVGRPGDAPECLGY
jgi:hypothetical protein